MYLLFCFLILLIISLNNVTIKRKYFGRKMTLYLCSLFFKGDPISCVSPGVMCVCICIIQDRNGQSPSQSLPHHLQWWFSPSAQQPDAAQHLQDAHPQIPLWRSELQPLLQVCRPFWWVCSLLCPSKRLTHILDVVSSQTSQFVWFFSISSQGDAACSLSQLFRERGHDDADPVRVALRRHDDLQHNRRHVSPGTRRGDLHCKCALIQTPRGENIAFWDSWVDHCHLCFSCCHKSKCLPWKRPVVRSKVVQHLLRPPQMWGPTLPSGICDPGGQGHRKEVSKSPPTEWIITALFSLCHFIQQNSCQEKTQICSKSALKPCMFSRFWCPQTNKA